MSEILGTLFKYLIAIACISGVLFILYDVLSANKLERATSQIYLFEKNISGFYTGGPAPATNVDITNIIINANAEPQGTYVNGNLVNPWGGAITIAGNQRTTGYIDIIYHGIPASACVKLALNMSSRYLITINNEMPSLASQGVINSFPSSLVSSAVPITMQQATQQCDEQTQYNQAYLAFTFPILQN